MVVPRDPSSPEGRALLIQQQNEALALEEGQASLCGEVMGKETLRYMSTTTTVRDMEEISRVLEGENAPINFVSPKHTILFHHSNIANPRIVGRGAPLVLDTRRCHSHLRQI